MRDILTITLNEIRVNFGNPTTTVFVVVLPIVFTVIIGLGLSGGGSATIIRLDVVDLDNSALSARLVETLRAVSGATLTLCTLTGERAAQPEACALPAPDSEAAALAPDALATRRIEDNATYAAVVIPEGFGARLLAGEDVNVAYRANSAFSAPTFIRQSVDAAVSRASGSVVAARLSTDAARTTGALDEAQAPAFFDDVYRAAETAWETPPAVLSVEATIAEEEPTTPSGFSQSAPGMACMFVMTNLLGVATSVVLARENWTFQRLMVMPVRRSKFMVGKMLAYYVVGVGQLFLILLVGALLGVNYGSDPLAVLALALVYTLAVAAMGLMMATFARTTGQAIAISNLVALVLAPLGGAWWPLDVVPQAMNVFGHVVSPIAWAMDAFSGMIYYGKGLVGILPYLGVLLIFAAVFLVVGVRRFKYEL